MNSSRRSTSNDTESSVIWASKHPRTLSVTTPRSSAHYTEHTFIIDNNTKISYEYTNGSGDNSPLSPRYSDGEKASESQATFQLLNAIIGAGVVGFPFCFKSCGILLAALIVVVVAIASEFSMRLLLISSHITGKHTYEQLARYSFSTYGKIIVDTCICVINLGCLVAYLNMITDALSSVAGSIIPPGAEPSRNVVLMAVTVCAVLPVALTIRSSRLISTISQASVGFLFFFALSLLVLACLTGFTSLAVINYWKVKGVLVSLPIIIFGFSAHQVLFSVYSSLKAPTTPKMMGVASNAMILAAVMYLAVGVSGYITFAERTNGDILRNLGGFSPSPFSTAANTANKLLQRIIKTGFALSLLASIPLLLLPLNLTFSPWLTTCIPSGTTKILAVASKYKRDTVLSSCFVCIACALAILVPNVEFVFGLAGATASVMLSFALPAVLFLHTTNQQPAGIFPSINLPRGSPRWHRLRQLSIVLLIFGVLIGIGSTSALILSMQKEAAIVQLAQEIVKEEKKVTAAVHVQAKAVQAAQTVDTVGKLRQELNKTHSQTGSAIVKAAEKASKAVEVLTSSKGNAGVTIGGGDHASIAAKNQGTSDSMDRPDRRDSKRHTIDSNKEGAVAIKAATSNLKPAAKAISELIFSLENAATLLDEAMSSAKDLGISGKESTNNNRLIAVSGDIRAATEKSLRAAITARGAVTEAQRAVASKNISAIALEAMLKNVVEAAQTAAAEMNDTLTSLVMAEEEAHSELEGIYAELEAQRKEGESKDEMSNDHQHGTSKQGTNGSGDAEKEKEKKDGSTKNTTPDGESGGSNRLQDDAVDADENDPGKHVEGKTNLFIATTTSPYVARNASDVTRVATDAAENAIEAAKAAASQALEKTTSDVAERAIEIAKELTANSKQQQKQEGVIDPGRERGDGALDDTSTQNNKPSSPFKRSASIVATKAVNSSPRGAKIGAEIGSNATAAVKEKQDEFFGDLTASVTSRQQHQQKVVDEGDV